MAPERTTIPSFRLLGSLRGMGLDLLCRTEKGRGGVILALHWTWTQSELKLLTCNVATKGTTSIFAAL